MGPLQSRANVALNRRTAALGIALFSFLLVLQAGCVQTRRAKTNAPCHASPACMTFTPGDRIDIDFGGCLAAPWVQIVRDDGTIALPFNLAALAVGKTAAQLEQAIHDLYVPTILTRLTVKIRPGVSYFFVTGEVMNPGQKHHTGQITMMKAISDAGGFTDFADKRRIEILRADGEIVKANGKAILKGAAQDVTIYPGDRVHVNRSPF